MDRTRWADFISKLNYIDRLVLLDSDMLAMFPAIVDVSGRAAPAALAA